MELPIYSPGKKTLAQRDAESLREADRIIRDGDRLSAAMDILEGEGRLKSLCV